MIKKQILILKTGTTNAPVVEKHGDYDDWFKETLSEFPIDWHLVYAYQDDSLPPPKTFDGILVTGSPSSAWEHAPWMQRIVLWLTDLIQTQSTPLLAVCFGHQLLGQALGGTVIVNPKGIEVGSIDVKLTPQAQSDPLLANLPSSVQVYSIHKDIVTNLPLSNNITRLGSTSNTEVQALAVGPMIRSLQFHPELSYAALSELLHVREIEAQLSSRNHGPKILQNWFRHWVMGAQS